MGLDGIPSDVIHRVVRLFDRGTQDAALDELVLRPPAEPEKRALATLYITDPNLRPRIIQIYPDLANT